MHNQENEDVRTYDFIGHTLHNSSIGRQNGFTYLALLFILAIAGIVLAMQASLYSFDRQREKEADLLRAGRDLKQALQSYSSAGTDKSFPRTLDALLEDRRDGLTLRRHLRRIPLDPMTGTYVWGHRTLDNGEIVAVFSTSDRAPVKVANFEQGEEAFSKAASYQGWEFVAKVFVIPQLQSEQ